MLDAPCSFLQDPAHAFMHSLDEGAGDEERARLQWGASAKLSRQITNQLGHRLGLAAASRAFNLPSTCTFRVYFGI